MMRRATATLAFILALGLPAVALANVGTPLMWAGAAHLFIGNAVIGVLEGGLLAICYKVRAARSVWLMILANYFSAWVGYVWLASRINQRLELDLYYGWRLLWEMIAVAYVVTIVLEWPFVAGCFAGQRAWFRKSWVASLIVQSASYALLFCWYALASGTSLFTQMSIVPLEDLSLPDDILVYYIGEADGDVYVRELGTGRTDKVFDLDSKDENDCLSISSDRSPSGDDRYALVAKSDSADVTNAQAIPIGIWARADELPHDDQGKVFIPETRTRPGGTDVPRLGAARDSPWSFYAGYWAISGLRGENSRTGDKIGFSFETPFAEWRVRHATLLPMERVLFQLGPRQICILEPETRRIALLTFGRGALAVVKSAAREAMIQP